jgi:uncharacterized protein YqhQ
MASDSFMYGGQAVIEGVMIRGRQTYCVAVREPAGTIGTRCWPISSFYTGRLRRFPLVRGGIVLLETLIVGMKALSYSANASLGEEQEIGKMGMGITLAIAMLMGVGLFFLAPLFLVSSLDRFIPSSILSNLIEGVIRLAIFLAYILLIGRMKDVRRVFGYHGAEHMAVHAQEAREPLTVVSVRRFSPAHPRCGTAFLLTVMVVAIIVFAFLGRPELPLRIASRIVLLPLIAGISYEVIRFSGMHASNALVRMLAVPNLALQALTTRQPEDDQIEVAIRALESAIASDVGAEGDHGQG